MKDSDDTYKNNFYTRYKKKHKQFTGLDVDFYAPIDYSWGAVTKCYFFNNTVRCDSETIFAVPHDWLIQYDPNIPIFGCGYHPYYLDLEKKKWTFSVSYLIRDRFYLYGHKDDGTSHSFPEEPRPYSIRESDNDWCITHFNFYPLYTNIYCELNFLSSLLMKNIDFSEFDDIIKVKRLKCPIRCIKYIKPQYSSQFDIQSFFVLKEDNAPCYCIGCRKDYRAIEVEVDVDEKGVTLHLKNPIN